MVKTAALRTALVLLFIRAELHAQELLPLRHVVVFNNNGRKPPTPNVYPLFRLSEPFALVENFYTPATLDATLTDNLARSRMLYIGQYCDEGPLFADPVVCKVLRNFLQGGGMIFFDYNTGGRPGRFSPDTEKFLTSVGVMPPSEFCQGYGSDCFAEANRHAVLSAPVPIGGKEAGHYGWWEKWPKEQIVLAHAKDDPGKATLLIQEGIHGKGVVMFNQLPGAFRSADGLYFDLVRNIIAYAYNEAR
ncbi:MAG: hypothetical protein AB1696_06785 [Planctomycetota bacterium]